MRVLDRAADWKLEGLCVNRTGREQDWWCPDDELTVRERNVQWAAARRICSRCPVRLACTADALVQLAKVDEHAMRGGLTPNELRRVAGRLGMPVRREAQHGTRARYVAGCHEGADGGACEACKRAHREYEHDRRLWKGQVGVA